MRQSIYRLAQRIASMDWPKALHGSPLAFSLSQVGDLCYLPAFSSPQKTFALIVPHSVLNGKGDNENIFMYGFVPLFPLNHPANQFHFLCCSFVDERDMDLQTLEATQEVRAFYREKGYGNRSIPVLYHFSTWQKDRGFRFGLLPWEEELMEQIMTSFFILEERLKTETLPELEEDPRYYLPGVYDQGEGHLRVINLWDVFIDYYLSLMVRFYQDAHVPVQEGIKNTCSKWLLLEAGEIEKDPFLEEENGSDQRDTEKGQPLPSCLPLSPHQGSQYILHCFHRLLYFLCHNDLSDYLELFHLTPKEIYGMKESGELPPKDSPDQREAEEGEAFSSPQEPKKGKTIPFPSPRDSYQEDFYFADPLSWDEDFLDEKALLWEDEEEEDLGDPFFWWDDYLEEEEEEEDLSFQESLSQRKNPSSSAKIIDIRSRKPWVDKR